MDNILVINLKTFDKFCLKLIYYLKNEHINPLQENIKE